TPPRPPLFPYTTPFRSRRVSLLFSGDAVPEAGAALTAADGKEAGYVTRAARIWDPPRIIGMGYVRKGADAPGATLHWPGGTATRSEEHTSELQSLTNLV